jgi:hypothetical protein
VTLGAFSSRAGRMRGMSEERKSNSVIVAVSVALVLGALATAYVVGYFTLPNRTQSAIERFRGFRYEWQITIYRPAARIESLVTGMETHLWHWGDDY